VIGSIKLPCVVGNWYLSSDSKIPQRLLFPTLPSYSKLLCTSLFKYQRGDKKGIHLNTRATKSIEMGHSYASLTLFLKTQTAFLLEKRS